MKRYALVEVDTVGHILMQMVHDGMVPSTVYAGPQAESRASALLKVARASNNYANPSAYEEEVIGIDAALDELRAVWPDWDEE